MTEMEAENKLYADTHGEGQGQNTPTPQQQQDQTRGFPSTVVASPYYAPPSGAGYGGGYGVPSSQQPQQVSFVAANQSSIDDVPHHMLTVAMVYGVAVLFCSNFFFGLIGFLLACK